MTHIVCPNNTYSHACPGGNIVWDATHFCPADKLTAQEAALFSVFPLTEVAAPSFDAITQQVRALDPALVNGAWTQQWEVVQLDDATVTANRNRVRADLAARIDAAVIAIYDKPMLLSKEYEAREAAAQAYKDAGYTGTVPARVQGFCTPSGMTAKTAADLILSQAAQLLGALDSLSDLRMAKYYVTSRDPITGQYVLSDAQAQASADSTLSQVATIAAALA